MDVHPKRPRPSRRTYCPHGRGVDFSGAWTVFEQTVRDLLERGVRVVVHLGENLHLQHTPRTVLEGLMSLNQEFEGQFEAYVVETPSAVFHTKAYWV